MELIELNAKKREAKGKGAARKLRANSAIPAIVYGAKADPVMLSLDTMAFDKVIRENGSSGLFFDLSIDDAQKKMVLLKEIQMDPFGMSYVHVDFQEVDMDHMVSVWVPVETTGVSPGVKDGGLLQIIRRELEVLCKPQDTPDSIVVDISGLDIGDAVHVADIDLGESIEIPHEVNFTVVTIVPPTTSSEGVAEAEAGGDAD